MKKISGILNKKINSVKETEQNSPRMPPGSPIFRRVRDELKAPKKEMVTDEMATHEKTKKYVNWDVESIKN